MVTEKRPDLKYIDDHQRAAEEAYQRAQQDALDASIRATALRRVERRERESREAASRQESHPGAGWVPWGSQPEQEQARAAAGVRLAEVILPSAENPVLILVAREPGTVDGEAHMRHIYYNHEMTYHVSFA